VVMAVTLVVFAVIKILSIPEINRNKASRMWCQDMIENKWKMSIQITLFNLFYTPLLFYFVLNMRDYTAGTAHSIASIAFSWVFFAVFILIFVMSTVKVIAFFRNYPKLSGNIAKATDLILQENEYHLMHSQNMFLFDMKKIDLRDLLYPKVNNVNILPFKCVYAFKFISLLCPSVLYLRALLLAVILVAAQGEPIIQTSLLIVVNIAVALFMIKARPYRFKWHRLRIRNYLCIFNEVTLIGFEIGLLIFALMERDGVDITTRASSMLGLSYYLLALLVVNFIYLLFRMYIEVRRRLWERFIETDCFKLNFPELAEEYEREKLLKKNKKLAKKLDAKQKETISAILRKMGTGRGQNSLRPNEGEKENPDLPKPFKITYFDRDKSSTSSHSTLSRKQRRDMIQKMFDESTGSKANPNEQWQQLKKD
jgi:hypothetical protein